MLNRSVVLLASLFLSTVAFAKSEYVQKGTCGSAKVVSGDTCSNVKVEISYEGCAQKADSALAQKIICSGDTIKARTQAHSSRWEAEFSKVSDGWGVAWKTLGPVKYFEKAKEVAVTETKNERAPAAANPVAIPPEQTPGTATVGAPGVPMKMSGFFDIRYSTYSADTNGTVGYPHAESGFGLEDGAIYLNYENAKVSFVMDMSIRRTQDRDYYFGTATIPNESNSNNIGIGLEKSQLYLRYKLNDSLVFDFGQFDTIFGVELNDSKDRVFGKAGLVYDAELPLTHTGFMVEYAKDGAYGKVFAANPNNRGSYGASSAMDTNTEYGAAIGYSFESIRGQLGYMTRSLLNAAGTKMDQRTLSDLTLGATLGKFTIDVEYALVADPSKNTLTSGDSSDSEKAGAGVFLLGTYKVCESMLLGLRYEHIVDDPSAASLKTADSYGISVHHKLSSDLELRAEYNGYNFEKVSGTDPKWASARFNAAALFTF